MNKRTIIGLILIIGFLLVGTILIIKSPQKIKYSNTPCYYYTNKTAGIIKLDGINSTDVNLYVNQNKTKFLIESKLTNKTLPECIQ